MQPLQKEERDWLVGQYYRDQAEHRRLRKVNAPASAQDAAYCRMNSRIEEYFERLPRVLLSRCPFTHEPLIRAFDPWGMDGFWWQHRKLYKIREEPPPQYFRLLLGAVHLNGLAPKGGDEGALIGPEVPYVIRRILEMPRMVAVISSVTMANGYVAFPIAYYSVTAPKPGMLTQSWREQTYGFTCEDGRPGWCIKSDPWEFDLRGWVEAGRVKWVNPGDPHFLVYEGSWEQFPYKQVLGRREQQTLIEDRLVVLPPPNNETYEPFE